MSVALGEETLIEVVREAWGAVAIPRTKKRIAAAGWQGQSAVEEKNQIAVSYDDRADR